MADPGSGNGGLTSLRSIMDNYDYLSNWLTAVATAGVFAGLATAYDKLTGAAILLALFTSTALAMFFWPILLEQGYGSLSWTLLFGVSCGVAGATVLQTMIYVIRKRVVGKIEKLGDSYLGPEEPVTTEKPT